MTWPVHTDCKTGPGALNQTREAPITRTASTAANSITQPLRRGSYVTCLEAAAVGDQRPLAVHESMQPSCRCYHIRSRVQQQMVRVLHGKRRRQVGGMICSASPEACGSAISRTDTSPAHAAAYCCLPLWRLPKPAAALTQNMSCWPSASAQGPSTAFSAALVPTATKPGVSMMPCGV